ncbi:MAG: hypothetical protein G01um101449_298 [Parcubacteria group bacterium Gr01-1014_49]|nr:MAG: hypothetical protein G01um101449_298 [Parcubacteria group bacterium Gr01-1014_49]
MHSVEEIRKFLYQVFGSIGMSDPNKTRLANFLSKPIFLIVLLLLVLGSVFYAFPGLRTYVPFAQEEISRSTTTTAITVTATNGGVAIGRDNYGNIETNMRPKPDISFDFSIPNHPINPDLYGATFHFEITNFPVEDASLIGGRRIITNDGLLPYLEKIEIDESLNCTILTKSLAAILEMGTIGVKVEFDMDCTSYAPILSKEKSIRVLQ